jgi:hypothetical protein
MTMPYYTLIMDYLGGTYISQASGASPELALLRAVKELDVSGVQGLGTKTKESLIRQLKEDAPTPLTGLQNVWCISAEVGGHLVLMNLVQTELQ